MKKISMIVCLLVTLSVSCLASVVPPKRAAAIASTFLSKRQPGLSAVGNAFSVELVATFPSVPTKAPGQEPALYVYEGSRGGYVVVAGDDVSAPILGYSLSGRFPAGDIPVSLKSLLDWHASVIEYARAQGWTSEDSGWETDLASDNERTVIETARWGQDAPFNNLVPDKNGRKCPSGCVATAMAIIMRHHQYPEHGTGELPGYDLDVNSIMPQYARHIDGHSLGHTYDWSLMPMRYVKGQYSEEEAAQVAQLMYDLGVMSQMDYQPEGSGATSDSPLGLIKYFGYDKQMRYLMRESYDTERWERLIRQDINEGLPVFYGGFSFDGGHAFVVDGYEGEYFRLNYGWEGTSDFYRLSPSIKGRTDKLTEFSDWQDMVCRIMPDRGGETYVSLQVGNAFRPFPWDFRSSSFEMPVTWIWCFTAPEWVNLEMAYALYDKDYVFRERVSEPFAYQGEDSVPKTPCQLTQSISDGDRLLLACRNGDKWEPVPQSRQSHYQFDRRPLSELVSVGFMLGNPVIPMPDGYPGFYLDGHKDIYWEIWSDDLGRMLTTSADASFYQQINGIYYSSFASVVDEQTGRTQFLFYYPSGRYRFILRNFDEEMELTVTF